jgi:RNA polymerase sigma-70 factor, ECF subfamily
MPRPVPTPRLRLVEGGIRDAEAEAAPADPLVDDSELLQAVRSGDDWAATAFCHRVRPRIQRTVERLLGPRDTDLHDLIQVSLIEMVRTIHRFRGDCSLDTWTSTVTAHAVWKHIRRRRIERRLFDPGASEENGEAPDTRRHGNLNAEVVSRDLVRRVRVHLASMDPDRAWAFLLHDVGGHDLREVASIVGVSVAAAQKRLVRGRQELRVRLANDPELAQLLQSEEEAP